MNSGPVWREDQGVEIIGDLISRLERTTLDLGYARALRDAKKADAKWQASVEVESLVDALADGKSPEAIEIYRELTGCSSIEAQVAIGRVIGANS